MNDFYVPGCVTTMMLLLRRTLVLYVRCSAGCTTLSHASKSVSR